MTIGSRGPALLVMFVASVVAGCGAQVPRPSESIEMGSIAIRVEQAPGGTEFFRSEHHVRVVSPDGTIAAELTMAPGAESRTAIPAGSWTLEAFTVFFSDFIRCTADPSRAGAQVCGAPSLRPAQVCSIPLTVTPSATVTARFEIRPAGRCGLAEEAADPPASPAPSA